MTPSAEIGSDDEPVAVRAGHRRICPSIASASSRDATVSRCARRSRATTPSSGWPDASRLAPPSGSWRAEPSVPTARAGERPTQARCSASSPFRKRCARTPPVARPLAGNSVNGLTLALPGSVPSRVSLLAAIVTTTASAAASAGMPVKWMTCAPDAEVDARHAAGRTPLRPHRGRREPQQLGVGCHEHELVGLVALHGADDLVAGLEADHLELGLVRVGAGGRRASRCPASCRARSSVRRRARRSRAPSRRGSAAPGSRRSARRRRAAPTSAAASGGRPA